MAFYLRLKTKCWCWCWRTVRETQIRPASPRYLPPPPFGALLTTLVSPTPFRWCASACVVFSHGILFRVNEGIVRLPETCLPLPTRHKPRLPVRRLPVRPPRTTDWFFLFLFFVGCPASSALMVIALAVTVVRRVFLAGAIAHGTALNVITVQVPILLARVTAPNPRKF